MNWWYWALVAYGVVAVLIWLRSVYVIRREVNWIKTRDVRVEVNTYRKFLLFSFWDAICWGYYLLRNGFVDFFGDLK